MNILQRELQGEEISVNDPDYIIIRERINKTQQLTAELNNHYHDEQEVRALFSELIEQKLDQSFRLLPPFYTDYGRNIKIGYHVFINHACTFMDRGGIIIEDHVLIGPKVNLITINHPIEPKKREQGITTYCKPIHIKKNVWIGVAATILPGVTIGENSIISAGAVVTKDVPDNVVIAGVPGRIIKRLD